MRRDHICFGLFLALLFIAPKLPLSDSLNLPSTSALSLGFIGLLFWVVASPGLILSARKVSWPLCMIFLVAFAVYAWVISAFSFSIVSISYASQYLFYTLFGALILGAYLHKAYRFGELDKVFGVFIAIGMIFSIGGLVSVFTGPIYPHQTLATMHHWEGINIQRGVGFAESPNAAGSVLIAFLAATLFLYPSRWRHQWLVLTLIGIALLATLSRSAILSFVIAGAALLSIWLLRILATRWVDTGSIHKAAKGVLSALGIGGIIVLVLRLLPPSSKQVLSTVTSGFGIGGSVTLNADISNRVGLWHEGLQNWWQRGAADVLCGVGFRNSMILGEQAWRTSHNFYIAALGDFGVFGFVLFVSALGAVILGAVSKILSRRKLSGIYPFVFLCVFGMSVHNMTETFFYSPRTLTMLVFCMVLLGTSKYMIRDALEKRHYMSPMAG